MEDGGKVPWTRSIFQVLGESIKGYGCQFQTVGSMPTLRNKDRFPGTGATLAACWLSCTVPKVVQEACFPHQLIKEPSSVDQLVWGVEFGHFPLLQDYNSVRVQNRVDTMSDCDDGPVLEHSASKCGLQHRVRFDVDSGCRLVQHQNVAWSQ